MHTGVLGDEYMYTDLHVLGQSFWGELLQWQETSELSKELDD